MKNNGYHTRAFIPRYYEMDRFGRVTPLTMMSLFEETAFTHCQETGLSVYDLRDQGFGWVLLHGTFRMRRYPRHRENFTIGTRLVSARRFFGKREFVVHDENGALIGSSETLWAFYDLERRRPAPILDSLLRAWGHDQSVELGRGTPRLDPPGPGAIDPTLSYMVRISDIDTNGHVNNVNYLEWALEAVPLEVHENYCLAFVQGVYRHQVTYGSTVRVAREHRHSETSPLAYEMALYSDGRPPCQGGQLDPVAYARTEWLPRSG